MSSYLFTATSVHQPERASVRFNSNKRGPGGGIWRLSTEGLPPLQLASNSRTNNNNYTEWNNCYWSPDSQYVVCHRRGLKKGKLYRDIVILSANGGPPVKEFNNAEGWPIRWVSSSPSP